METSQQSEAMGGEEVAASDDHAGRPLIVGKVTLEMKQKDERGPFL